MRALGIGNAVDAANMTMKAWRLCEKLHEGQTDKAGEPYWMHPWRVAHIVGGNAYDVCVAYLHDVVEDTDATLDELAGEFPAQVTAALDAITRRDGEVYKEYISRLAEDRIAYRVKVADLLDNLDPSRSGSLSDTAKIRYVKALAYLLGRDDAE